MMHLNVHIHTYTIKPFKYAFGISSMYNSGITLFYFFYTIYIEHYYNILTLIVFVLNTKYYSTLPMNKIHFKYFIFKYIITIVMF